MHTVLTLQIAIGIVATLYLHCHTLNAGLIAVEQVGNGSLITVSLCPAHIHTHEHRSPVLSLCATSAGVDLQNGFHRVFLLTEHVLQFQILNGLKCFGIVVLYFLFRNHLVLEEVKGQL